jgi:hypothetical protein
MVGVTGIWVFVLLNRTSAWHPELRWTILIASGLVTAALLTNVARFSRIVGAAIAGAMMVTVLAGPAAFAMATAATTHQGSIPSSGPSGSGQGGPGGQAGQGGGMPGQRADGQGQQSDQTGRTGTRPEGGFGQSGTNDGQSQQGQTAGPGGQGGGASTELATLLKATNTTWAAAISGATSAAELELASGTSVIALGGWDGSDPSPTLAEFQKYVRDGKIRYLISGGNGMGRGGMGGSGEGTSATSQITSWVTAHYQSTTVGSSTVYDLTKTTTTTTE